MVSLVLYVYDLAPFPFFLVFSHQINKNIQETSLKWTNWCFAALKARFRPRVVSLVGFFCLQRQVGSNHKFICPHLGQCCCNGRGEQSRGKWWKRKGRTQEAVIILRKLVEGRDWEDGWSLPILDGWCMSSMNVFTNKSKSEVKTSPDLLSNWKPRA